MYGTRDNTTGLTATDTNATQRVEVVQASKSATSAIADRPGATTVNTVQNEVTSTNYVIGGFSLNAAVVETARLRPAAGQGVEFDVYNTAGIGTQFTITKE
jgi:hypothetical protein